MKTVHRILSLVGLWSLLAVGQADDAFSKAFRTSLLKSLDDASGKLVSLADAIPEDKYDWRPMDGVNSVREILVHVTETNYSLAERLGAKTPPGIDRGNMGPSMKTKAQAIAATKEGIGFIRKVLTEIPVEELLPEVNVFGSNLPKLRVAMLPVDHAHEHLGQLIAYARMNHIVPPWSR